MMAEEIFVRCMRKKDGETIAKLLAKLYVLIHLEADYTTYLQHESNSIFLELANHFLLYIEADLTKTDGCHAAILSALYLSDDLADII